MFDRQLEDCEATVYICAQDKATLDEKGFCGKLQTGHNHLTYQEAVAITDELNKIYPSVNKYSIKRFRTILNQVMFAFGPEFIERHKRY